MPTACAPAAGVHRMPQKKGLRVDKKWVLRRYNAQPPWHSNATLAAGRDTLLLLRQIALTNPDANAERSCEVGPEAEGEEPSLFGAAVSLPNLRSTRLATRIPSLRSWIEKGGDAC